MSLVSEVTRIEIKTEYNKLILQAGNISQFLLV